MSRHPKTEKFAEGVPLAMIIKREIKASPELVMMGQAQSLWAEKFRRLKTTLAHRYGSEAHVIVVTSGVPGEGKSSISMNLALTFAAEPGAKVLVVDGDLRRPTLDRWLQPPPRLGLAEVLGGRADLVQAIVQLSNSSLHVLPAGSRVQDPLELLTGPEAKGLFRTLRETYDRVIVDTPPVIPFTDADVLASMSDGVVMIVRAGTTPKSAVAQQLAAITSSRILGFVLNGAAPSLADGRQNYDQYYHRYYADERTPPE